MSMIFVGIFIVAEPDPDPEPPHKRQLYIKTERRTYHNIPYNEKENEHIEQQENVNRTPPIPIPKTPTINLQRNPYSSGYTQ